MTTMNVSTPHESLSADLADPVSSFHPVVDPELNLLLTVAAPQRCANGDVGQLIPADFDWERFADMADWHGLAPRAYALLRQQPNLVPQNIMDRLHDKASASAAMALHLAGQLIALSSRFRAEHISHIVYKGPLLASMLYGNLALRVSSDLDIVVPKAELDRARSTLAGMGFVDKHGLSEKQQTAAFRFGCEHSFWSPQTGTTVDLHWRIFPRFVSPSLGMDSLFGRVIDAPMFDASLPTFCPEDLLLVLCLHAAQHDWAHLGLFTDIVQLLRKYPALDWRAFEASLRDWNTRRMVHVSLTLAQSWEADLPASIVESMTADRELAHLADKVRRRFWPSRFNPLPKDADIKWLAERTKGEPVIDRLRWMTGFAFNPTLIDYVVFDLPSSVAGFYPVLRALRLALKRTGLVQMKQGS